MRRHIDCPVAGGATTWLAIHFTSKAMGRFKDLSIWQKPEVHKMVVVRLRQNVCIQGGQLQYSTGTVANRPCAVPVPKHC